MLGMDETNTRAFGLAAVDHEFVGLSCRMQHHPTSKARVIESPVAAMTCGYLVAAAAGVAVSDVRSRATAARPIDQGRRRPDMPTSSRPSPHAPPSPVQTSGVGRPARVREVAPGGAALRVVLGRLG